MPVDHHQVLAIIEQAGQHIADASNFCTGALARDIHGRETMPGRRCRSFCPIGAILFFSGASLRRDLSDDARTALVTAQLAASQLYKSSLEVVADERGHLAVMDVMRRAWVLARSRT